MRRVTFLFLLTSLLLALPSMAHALTADNPLNENAFTWTGHGGVVVEGAGAGAVFESAATSVGITTIPSGSTVVQAYLYSCQYGGTGLTASGSIDGTTLATVSRYSNDSTAKVYRWDVTSIVTGNGVYSITTSSTSDVLIYAHELLIVFSNPSSLYTQVIVNDGAEALQHATTGTTFHGVGTSPTSATIYFSIYAANEAGMASESASFNSLTLASDIWDADHGNYLDIDVFGVTPLAGDNTAGVTTGVDSLVWHLAVLEVTLPASVPAPEFSQGVPMITSIAAALYLFIKQRIGKREE